MEVFIVGEGRVTGRVGYIYTNARTFQRTLQRSPVLGRNSKVL